MFDDLKTTDSLPEVELQSADSLPLTITSSSGKDLRVVSTLQANPDYFLTKRERKDYGFLYFFGNNHSTWSEAFFAGLVFSQLFPDLAKKFTKSGFKAIRKGIGFKDHFEAWKTARTGLSIRKDSATDTIKVRVPVFVLASQDRAKYALMSLMNTGPEQGEPTPEELSVLESTPLSSIKDLSFSDWEKSISAYVSTADVNALKKAKAVLSFSSFGPSGVLCFLEFTATKKEVEFITNMGFLQVRPMDMFGPAQEWVYSYFGRFQKTPEFSIPLARIQKETEGKGESRLDTNGLLVDEHAEMFAFDIPSGLESIRRFEDKLSTAYLGSDGEFSSLGVDTKLLPKSMPILVDWVNLKFSYTSTDGRMLVKNLDRCIPAKKFHFVNFLSLKIDSDKAKGFLTLGLKVAQNFGLLQNLDTPALIAEISTIGRIRDEYKGAEDIGLYEIFAYAQKGTTAGGAPNDAGFYCLQLVEGFRQLEQRIKDDPENAYSVYSTLTILSLAGFLRVFNLFGPTFFALRRQDEDERRVYLNQGQDPEYKAESLPFIADNVGKLPHQVKVENQLRESPDNAALPVDTGGGKSMICITDILKEMKTSAGPFLIVCPAHLVAQYTKEIVYFTQGQVNAIPVNSYVIRRHGFGRLQAMIENAPPNTIVITDFLAVVFKANRLAYGVSGVNVYPVVEFLRQFRFQYVFIDECHQLRNGTTRQQAVNRLAADIKKKRIASGTLVTNTLIDLVKQIALMDPTVLGTVEDFIENYALETRGNKVLTWKPGAEIAIKNAIKGNVVIAEAKKKEWAAILPKPRERFHRVDLTPKQRELYETILNEVIEKIKAEAANNQSLQLLLSGKATDEDGNEVDSDISVDQILRPYIARLEQFLNAPAKDALGAVLTDPMDRVSGKARKIVEICQDHIRSNTVGKILIFTNYTDSAAAVYEAFPEDMRNSVILYSAANKEADLAAYEQDDSKKILVGVEVSLNTGGNLQYASRLIRCETVFTPGVLEQGNARIGRPNIKVRENRQEINYDWIVSDKTIDVTKISYLISKTITKAKFDEAGNPRFDDLEVPPLFSMTLDTIRVSNEFDEVMLPYFEKYQAFQQAQFAEYAEYREKNKKTLFNEDGSIKLQKIESSGVTAGSALIRRVPYVPGTEIYKAHDLGLLRYDEFLRKDDLEDEMGGDEEEDEADDGANSSALEMERSRTLGLFVHTDRGDGEIVRVSKSMLVILLSSGEKIKVRKMAAFIVTRAETSNKDIRNSLLKAVGKIPLQTPIDVLEPRLTDKKAVQLEKEAVKKKADERVVLELELTIVNDYLGLRLANVDNELAASTAQSLNFKYSPAYFAAEIPTAAHMLKFFKELSAKGFQLDKFNSTACRDLWVSFQRRGKKATVNMMGAALEIDVKNFYREEFKPNPDRMHVNLYPLIQDGTVYLAMPMKGHPGSLNTIRSVRVPGIKWGQYDSGSELVIFTNSKSKAIRLISNLAKKKEFVIPNAAQLVKQITKLRLARDNKD